ncbi:MAG: biopolymer transporter ExbD [Hyphomonadaceae bacterium]
MAGKISTGGGGKRGQLAPNSDPNVIPFIDIMLVLLIIFMVTAPIPTVDIRVDLPPPNPIPMPPVEGQKPTMVTVLNTGNDVTIAIDGIPTTMARLGDDVLLRAIENNPSLPVTSIYAEAKIFVRADQSTRYGRVVGVMSRLQEEGFVKVGIFAELAQEG